ncbi:multiple sugar transport system permease protein [Actinoplanes lutulentus]|uniref:Carbohydrate ABC transporter membrane protein 1 (CUT1 family) n=1 Tax=Actinoplanes lutulentus TaxID=1287878 RepID=A0A327ZQJ1_9ACTN|nr:sugar ABC transporter permease [Actinoplanes lutulentus]MBB2940879.1 multiple sugar transport system permease protein [Actinoplanes lutulentus]RAK43188.1 carbohydrate ABC transporter membrane protein 1 (CUT1 family) [Actinoplanes lutulentus]
MAVSTVAKPVPKARRAKISDRTRKERNLGWMLAGPAFLAMVLVTGYPILNALWLSLFDYRLTDPAGREFIGLGNYAMILTDGLFWRQFGVTSLITVVTVAIELVLGFALAMVMHRALHLRTPLRTAILVPYGIITVVSAYAWAYAFSNTYGFVNPLLGLGDFDWFGGTWSALFTVCVAEIWKTTPFMSLLLLAGLAQIPEDYLEAAKVDGARAWQRVKRVILPNMKAAIMVALLFRTLDAFRIFDSVFIMTAGAQGTETLSFLAYRQTISRVMIGLGSAVSVILAILVVLIAFLFIKVFRTDLSQARGDRK